MPHPVVEVSVYQSYCKRTFPLYHALVVAKNVGLLAYILAFQYKGKYTKFLKIVIHYYN